MLIAGAIGVLSETQAAMLKLIYPEYYERK